MDAGMVFERAWEMLGAFRGILETHFPKRDERQEFIDRAAIALMSARTGHTPEQVFRIAQRMWQAREQEKPPAPQWDLPNDAPIQLSKLSNQELLKLVGEIAVLIRTNLAKAEMPTSIKSQPLTIDPASFLKP